MRRASFWTFLGWFLAAAAWGQCNTAANGFGAIQFQWDNDSFVPDNPTDRDYTNGLRLAFTRNTCESPDPPRWTEKLVETWCRTGVCGGEEHQIDVGFAIGQSIYTPSRYDTSRPQPNDRPYAGHLFASLLLQATHRDPDADDLERVQTTFEMQLGLVGPHAYGEQAQNGWHRLLDEREAKGWDNQLEDEPTLNLNLLWRRKLGGRHLDLVPHWGLALGTVSTHANLGATLRIGTDLSRLPHFGLPQVRRNKSGWRFDATAFLAADARYVAHNIFLDGGVFEKLEGWRIDPESFVYDLKAGFDLRPFKGWTFHYTWIHRSREFESRTLPDGGDQISAAMRSPAT
jgi:lipid A 3-O-deacylase